MITEKEFIKACKIGNIAVVKQYIADGGDVDATHALSLAELGWTGLMYAARYGHLDCISVLIAAGADVNIKAEYDGTALIYAAGHGYTDCARELISAGADVNAMNENGKTALITALFFRNYEAAQLLVVSGADIYTKDALGRTAINFCKDEAVKKKLIQMYITKTAIASSDKPYIIKGFDSEL